MKILINGGAGTLGSNIIERLYHQSSIEIMCVDNFETGSRANIPFFPDEKIIAGSITDFNLIENIFRTFEPDIVIHSAASYKDPDNYQHDANTNILGAINIGLLSKEYKVSKVINFQTALCYGIPQQLPIPVDHPLTPFTSYGISKTQGEYYLSQMDIPLVSLRLANICSKNLSIGPIPTFYSRIQEGKSCFCSNAKRDFLYFDDFYDLLNTILFDSDQLGYFNVSTGEGKSIAELFEAVKKSMNAREVTAEVRPINEDDIPEVVLDPSATQMTFGWKAKVDFEQMIQKQIEYYNETGIDQIFSHLKHKK